MCIGCPAERLGKAMKEIHTWRLDREPSDGAVALRNFYTGYHFSRRMKTLYPVCLFLVAAAPFCCCESPPPTGGMISGMRNTLEKKSTFIRRAFRGCKRRSGTCRFLFKESRHKRERVQSGPYGIHDSGLLCYRFIRDQFQPGTF